MATLTLIQDGNSKREIERNLSDAEKLVVIRNEINAAIQERIARLKREAEGMRVNMESILFRIGAQGLDITLDDLKTASWHRTATEIRMLQSVKDFLEGIE